MSSGKATENKVALWLRKAYGTRVDIQRLPDKYDTGNYEDVRPCDHLVVLAKELGGDIFYIESKETARFKASFNLKSTFRNGQIQGMKRAYELGHNYFVVFQILESRKVYLVPAIEILNLLDMKKASIPMATINLYPWNGEPLNEFIKKR